MTVHGLLQQQVRPHHEATLLDDTAQSVRNGESLRDRSGQPDDVNSQEVSNSQNFISANKTENKFKKWIRVLFGIIHGKICHQLMIKVSSILCLFGFCVVSWKDPSTSRCQRSLEEKDRMDHNFSKLHIFWWCQWSADWIRVEHLHRIR